MKTISIVHFSTQFKVFYTIIKIIKNLVSFLETFTKGYNFFIVSCYSFLFVCEFARVCECISIPHFRGMIPSCWHPYRYIFWLVQN